MRLKVALGQNLAVAHVKRRQNRVLLLVVRYGQDVSLIECVKRHIGGVAQTSARSVETRTRGLPDIGKCRRSFAEHAPLPPRIDLFGVNQLGAPQRLVLCHGHEIVTPEVGVHRYANIVAVGTIEDGMIRYRLNGAVGVVDAGVVRHEGKLIEFFIEAHARDGT